jgi:hypothetical protein
MRGRNPSAAPGLEDGRGRATIGAPSLFCAESSIFELSCDKCSCEARPVAYAGSANTKLGNSSGGYLQHHKLEKTRWPRLVCHKPVPRSTPPVSVRPH